MVWENVEHTFSDNDPFCQAILKKHWPNSTMYGDIRDLTLTDQFDLVTGGFPCQPFSHAGRKRGTADNRHLWPEMLRVIRNTQPEWVVAENVAGILSWDGGVVFEQVCTDLESEGYEVQPLVIPAVAVNAPHRRDRVWFIGHAQHHGRDGSQDGKSDIERSDRNAARPNQDVEPQRPAVAWSVTPDTQSEGLPESRETRREAFARSARRGGLAHYASWQQPWPEVAAKLCTLDDGLPNGLVRPKGWRNAAIKAAGNAIVPEVAAMIFRAIKSAK